MPRWTVAHPGSPAWGHGPKKGGDPIAWGARAAGAPENPCSGGCLGPPDPAETDRGAEANICRMPTRKRVPSCDAKLCKQRNQVERFYSKLKHFRAVAPRHDTRDDNFPASVQLASLRIWLRACESVA